MISREVDPKHLLMGERTAEQEMQQNHSDGQNPSSKYRFVNGGVTLALTYGGQLVRGI